MSIHWNVFQGSNQEICEDIAVRIIIQIVTLMVKTEKKSYQYHTTGNWLIQHFHSISNDRDIKNTYRHRKLSVININENNKLLKSM